MDFDSLLIDQRSASAPAPRDDVRDWANGRRVFVSSLISDMPQERSAVRTAIEELGATPVMFEDLGPQDISAEAAYLTGVRTSEVYVGLWGPRYGVRMPDGYSATHAEYLEAERTGLRLCLFVHGETSGEMDGPQRDLIQSARNLYTTSTWSDPADLARRVHRRLVALADEALAPWVRLGRALFRARKITDDGRTVVLSAVVRDEGVHAELVRLRDNRASAVPFTAPNSVRAVRVTEMSSTTTSTIGHEVRLTLDVQHPFKSGIRMSLNGVPADEMTRRALSDGLFGTSLLNQQIASLSRPIDPFEPLRSFKLDDVVLRPVAQLLFTDRLLSEGAASRIDSFTLGPSHGGSRRLQASWSPPQQYPSGPDPDPITIDGLIQGL